MTSRRLLAAGVGVAALLAVAGIASHGRPLSGGAGRGPTATFFDYLATSLVIFCVVVLAVVAYALLTGRERGGRLPDRSPWYLLSSILAFSVAALLAFFILHTGFAKRLRSTSELAKGQQTTQTTPQRPANGKSGRNAHLRWDEIAIVVALLGGTAVVLFARRRTKRTPRAVWRRREAAVSLALDESLDDLRSDPDLRRAIVAAYARMEHALAAVGLPRHPSEAPFEYMARALASLAASAAAAERLTSLFEWAKFSHHEPGPEMRDEAIDALVAVRDELRAPPALTVAA